MHPMLNTAVKAARRGASIINRASFDLDRVTVTEKQHNDFVTEVDQAAEQAIIEILQNAYPSHAILAEESGASANLHDENENVWIIDPLDGTTNFIHGYPQYCVSIALQQRGIITQAVIYDPSRNDLFTASKGAGAHLNEKRIRVTKRDKLRDALLGTSLSHGNAEKMEEFLKMYSLMSDKSHGVRHGGSAALDLAYVACGYLDGYFSKGLRPWDIAAGSLLITESGGIMGDFSGESNYLDHGNIITGNPKIFVQMLTALKPFIGK